MRIEHIADHPAFIPTLARWHHHQWPHGSTVRSRVEAMESQRDRRVIPLTGVALTGREVLGSASLLENDMDTHPELTPWLASVYVAPEHRGRGAGSALARWIVKEANRLGFTKLHLFTPDQESLYARLGWRVRGRETYRGEGVVVMEREL